jgi:hypothetical protein
MLSDDELDRMLRGSDPVRGGRRLGLADPGGPAGLRVLTAVRRRVRRSRIGRMAVVPAVAVALVGATAATQAWIAGDGEGHALESIGVTCNHPSEPWDAGVHFDILSETPVEACERQWQEMFGTPAPSPLVACVDSVGHRIEVYQGGPEQCARNRSDLYAGPTAEQLRLARFRADLEGRFAGETCVPYPELRAAIVELLAERDLTGWTVEHVQTAEPASEESCVQIGYYDEPNRTVVVEDTDPGDPMRWP